jgi:bifunctional DNA-binding transcriptional regulator/antitoxin component of YhaV-PrlF toxin-antitoxin module
MKSASVSAPRAGEIAGVRIGERGEVKVPSRYRRAHKLAKGSRMVAVEVGEALVLLPPEAALEHLSRRIQTALAQCGVTTEQALQNLDRIRRRRFRRLHGKP